MPPVHSAAAQGFAAAAATYAVGRPDYPAALDGWLAETLALAPGRRVLDLGSGTGKFLPRLLATGAEVIAVEPVEEMRAELTRAHPGVEARAGTAEAIPFPDASFDAVVCAQSFHWFSTAAALAEIRRVVRPGGTLGLVWNVRDERVPWVAEIGRLLVPLEGDAPRFHSGRWRDPFPARGFSALEESVFAHGHTGPAERVIVDRTASVSFVAASPEATRSKVTAALRAVIAATPELAGCEIVTFPYLTRAYACRAIG